MNMSPNVFWDTYAELARMDCCDLPGTPEYGRVLELWIAAGKPHPISAFIIRHANATPFGGPRINFH